MKHFTVPLKLHVDRIFMCVFCIPIRISILALENLRVNPDKDTVKNSSKV